MAQYMIALPFRKTNSVDLANAIKQYISTKYDQHPDMFKEDLQVIESLRRDAVHVREPHPSGIRKLAAYAGQLSWLGGKFPIDIGVDFNWYPALGYNLDRPVVENNLKFELANVLWNLAALYSQLAIFSNRGSVEGLKSACNYLSLSAGVLSYIRTQVLSEMLMSPPEDLDEPTLDSLEQLLLAQCQECFWQKAVMDGYKDASIAKLAAKVSDFYALAGDWAMKSDAISSEWIHQMAAKHHHFAAAAQLRQSLECLEKRKYGEEVARLKDSLICINEALKEQRYINKTILQDINGLKNRVSEDLKRAEKDNDMIYLNPVPPKSELKILDRATMAVSKVPKEVSEPSSFIDDRGEFGPPLFAKLVPYAVHVAATIYEERRDRIVNSNIIDQLEILTTMIHDTLSSLNLPGALQALEKPLGLPPTLLAHTEEIRQADAIMRLQRSFSDINKLKETDMALLTECKDLLSTEQSEDGRLRSKYGTDRWQRAESQTAGTKVYAKITEIDTYLNSAASSDELVMTKFRESEPLLRILSSTDREIGNFVPSSRRVEIPPKLDEQVSRLRNSLNEMSRFESRRRRKIESLRDKAKRDDINASILAEAARLERDFPSQVIVPAHFEDFFEKRLTKYDGDIESLKTESDEQSRLIQALQVTHKTFVAAKAGWTSSKEREQALQKLENAYFKYKEIVNNLDGARNFYNNLAKLVGNFRSDCKTFTYERREEAKRLENELNLPPLTSLSIRNHQAPPPPPDLHQVQDRPPTQPRTYNTRSNRLPPAAQDISEMPAPVPTRVAVAPSIPVVAAWNPDMGIKFGGGSGLPQPESVLGEDDNIKISMTHPGQKWDPHTGIRFG